MEEIDKFDVDDMLDELSGHIENMLDEWSGHVENMLDELSGCIEDTMEDALADQVEDAVMNALHDVLPEVLSESFSNYEFVLKDGTTIRPKQYMKLLSPDKSTMVLCYGGLRVVDSSLWVQTRISSWEAIAHYQSRGEAIEALAKVKNAMEANLPVFEL